ncbi:MAG: ATP-dependent Clp protease proteolytic subunit [Candidatus Korarchaeota archaeon]|nr:ATP-dependent Clp protease proteolytic subunit [Candidatus Korarchaeota archaeon]
MWLDPISLLWWLFIFYLLMVPQLQHRSLQTPRKKLMAMIARKRGSSVITLIHREESLGLFGIPFYRYIDIDDSESVLRVIRSTPPDTPIDLIIHTPGGLVLAAAQIARALKKHPAKTTVIIPHYAMSGGTLIALAADEIIMDENAVLGPVDPQLGQYPAPSLVRVVEKKTLDKVDDQTLILADVAEKAIKQVRDLVAWLLEDKMGRERAEEVARILTEGRWTHDYPITVEVAKELGLPVSADVPPEVYQLMDLFPQPLKSRSQSVEFFPALPKGEGKKS